MIQEHSRQVPRQTGISFKQEALFMTYLTAPTAAPAVMAFFTETTSRNYAQNDNVMWVKTGGSSSITISAGEVITLPAGFVWAITTQIPLKQDADREFILWDGSAEYPNSQRLAITASDTGSRMSFNVLSTETGSKSFSWRYTSPTTYTVAAYDSGMQIVGVLK
jgi:hypothetical protein